MLVLVVVTKELLFRFLFRTGESIDSKAMRTDAWHHRSDSLTSLAAFIGISIALWGGKGYEPADDWAALFAAGVIAFNGVRLFRTAWREIMDASLPEKVIDDIREIARHVDGVAGIDMCRVRKSGLGLWVDIHVEVHGDMTVRDGHEIAHRVKDALLGVEAQRDGRGGAYRAGRHCDCASNERAGTPLKWRASRALRLGKLHFAADNTSSQTEQRRRVPKRASPSPAQELEPACR